MVLQLPPDLIADPLGFDCMLVCYEISRTSHDTNGYRMWTSFGDWCKVTFFSHNYVDFTSVGTYDASYWITPLENMYYGSHLLHTLECEKNILYPHPVHHCTFTKFII